MKRMTRAAVLVTLLSMLPATPAAAQTPSERLQFFGHLTQAFAGSTELPILGVPDGLTTDYRAAALQLRYAVTPSSGIVVQASHRRLGMSLLNDVAEEIELDWAFYQHRVGSLRVRVGRVPITAGLYNEIRDVGTLLPFYRAPANSYIEGTEAVDGLTLGYTRFFSDWSFEANAFGGATGYQAVFHTPAEPIIVDLHWDGSVGGNLWLATPLDGLRLGGSLMSFKPGEEMPETMRDRVTLRLLSLDGTFERWMLRGEYSWFTSAWMNTRAYYAQGGLDVWPSLALVAQAEVAYLEFLAPFPAPELRYSEDYAVGVNHRVRPDLVLKLEGHRARGYAFETWMNMFEGPGQTTYGIASIAVSF